MNGLKAKIINILRWSEKYAKTDMVYLAQSGSWLIFGQIVATGSAFLLGIAFANLLPKEVYGNYRYVLSLFSILAIPNLAGMETALTRSVAQGKEGALMPTVKARIRWGILGGLASIIVAFYYFFNGNNELTLAFLLAAAFIPLMDSFGNYSSFLSGKKLFNASTKYFSATQIVSVTSLLAALFLTRNLIVILLAYFLPYTLMRYAYLKLTLKKFQTNQIKDPEAISYGKHLSLMNIINTVASYLDKVLVYHYLGAVQLAIYSFSIAMPEQIKASLKSVGILSLPKFSQRSKEEIKKAIWGKTARLFLAISVIIIIYILSAPLIFKIFFPQYMESIFYSQIFSISLLAATSTLPSSAMQAQRAQKELYLYNTWSSVVQIILLFALLHFYGLLGIVLARVITRFFTNVLSFWYAWKM